ncbi:MAG: nitrilase family protein [Bacteroidales bacterium]|nr:nitrilase family protein [Bacteroidales bacterium]
MKPELTIALYQQDIVWENREANFAKVNAALSAALDDTARPDVVVLPETFTTGFGDQMARLAEEPEGATLAWCHALAQRWDALVIGSWTICEKNLVFNRMHLVEPSGAYHSYDKGHTFRMSSEAAQLARGTRRTEMVWRGWRLRPAVCYDLRFPLWLRNSNMLDYDVLVVSANWPGSRHEAWSTLLKARAIENLCYAVGCNRTGTDGTGIDYAGCSAIVDYKGFPLAEAGLNNETVVTATLSAEKLHNFRDHWPFNLDFDDPATLPPVAR